MNDRDRFDYLTGEIRRLAVDCDGHTYQLGVHLNEMSGGLYAAGGFDTLKQYIEEALPLKSNQAMKAMRIARAFAAEDASRFGIEKCDAWLRYIAATPEADAPAELRVARIPVLRPDGVAYVPAAEATVIEIEAAAALVRKSLEPSLPEDVRRLFVAFTAAALPGTAVRVASNGSFTFAGVTPANACAFFRAMRQAAGCGDDTSAP